MRSSMFLIVILLISLINISCNAGNDHSYSDSDIKLPPGFRISIYADNVPGVRSLDLGPDGIVFAGSRGEGKVYAIKDENGDNSADRVITIASGLNSPNGVAFREGSLYVAEINRILKFDDIMNRLEESPEPAVVNDNFPSDRHHGWKFIAFGPDDKLYVPVGAPCNICFREDERFSSIMRMDPDGNNLEVYSHGIRNTVGFAWHPQTNELWFTDNGRDMMGDDIPPDELNRAPEKDIHFGFPFIHGNNIPDPEFGEGKDLSQYEKPVQELGPHVAALGMRFYTGDMFPSEYKNQIFIAEHGSWNRSEKIGYRVMLVKLDGNKAVSYEPFAEGWLQGDSVSGRPVDVLIMPDGAMLVSDDHAGIIYRISYGE